MNAKLKINLSVDEAKHIVARAKSHEHALDIDDIDVTIEFPTVKSDYDLVMAVLEPLRYANRDVTEDFRQKIAQIKIIRALVPSLGLVNAKTIVESSSEDIKQLWDEHHTFDNYTNNWRKLKGISF